MQDLEYLIQVLKFCEKELTKVVSGGVVVATLWIMFKTLLFARISVPCFSVFL